VIRIAGGPVVIEFVVNEAEVAGYLARTPEVKWADYVVRALRVGSLAMDAAGNRSWGTARLHQ
jgi:hypothetical protein